MRARLADSGRGRDLGRAALTIGVLLVIAGWAAFVVPETSHIAAYVEGVGLLLAFLSGPFGRVRPLPVEGELKLLPGRVVFRADRTGVASFLSPRRTVRARDVLGGSSAFATSESVLRSPRASGAAEGPDGDRSTRGEGVTVAIARASRPADPTVLTLENEADADAVRRVLGIGHGGRGAIVWRTNVANDERFSFVLSVVLSLAVVWIAVTETPDSSVVALTIMALYALPVLLGMWALRLYGRRVLLRPLGVEVSFGKGQVQRFAYAEIASVRATRTGMRLELGLDHRPYDVAIAMGRGPLAAMTHAERDHLVAQIDAALGRSRGRIRPREDASARLEALRRRTGDASIAETAGHWLARLDALAASLLQPAGYRGAAVDAVDLWTVLEDPDADLELRCAAARVLTRQMDNLPNVPSGGRAHASRLASAMNRTIMTGTASLADAAPATSGENGANANRPRDAIRVATAVAASDPAVERKLRLAVESPADDPDEVDFAGILVATRARLRMR